MAKRCPTVRGEKTCPQRGLFQQGFLGRGPFISFLPSDITGLRIWLDDPSGDGNVVEDGSNNVSQWTDLSGNNNHAVQATAADQPLRAASEIQFDGASEFLDLADLLTEVSGDLDGEFFIIGDVVDATLGKMFIALTDFSTDDNRMGFGVYSIAALWAIEDRETAATNWIRFQARTTGIKLHSLSSNGSAYFHELNGVNQAVSAGVDNGDWFGDSPNLDRMRIASRARSAGDQFFVANLSSILYYTPRLSAANRLLVTTYLNNKFSIF